ncbi:hypothetical protein FACS1894206_07710 [Deltaproteobacteria bacterium]|nr:hypothetical protein FACS1894206_07710 [Deltaproteobacteria bacterium]
MKKLYARFCEIELSIAKAALCFTTIVIFFASIMRTLNHPLNWALEISLFVFAWCVFLSADVAIRGNRMINMDIFLNLMPKRVQTYCMILSYAIIIAFLCAMVGFGFYLSYMTRVRSFPGIPGMSYTWITLSLPVASLLMIISCGLKLREFVQALNTQTPIPPAGALEEQRLSAE